MGGANAGNVSYEDGPKWGQTLQGENMSFKTNFRGKGNTGSQLASAWRKEPDRMGRSNYDVAGEKIDPEASVPKRSSEPNFLGGSGATRTNAAGETVTGNASNLGTALGTILGLAVPVPGASMALGEIGGKLVEDRFSFYDGPRRETKDDGDDQDSVSEAEERSQQYTPGASKESDTLSATEALVGAPLTAAQRRKRALARSAITSTETPTGTLLGA
tara:strand:- start:1895 stop:2545 length:651 start_codon:yes stop_codon:yes gene_type:complete